MICYFNGEYTSNDKILLNINDNAFTRGYGAYACIRTYNKIPFYLEKHLNRLRFTIDELSIEQPTDNIEVIIKNLLDKNEGTKELVFRIYATESSLIISTEPLVSPSENQCKNGISTITTKLSRTLPHIKSTNYTCAMIAIKEAQKRNAEEAIYLDRDDNLLELTRANFFAIIGDTIYTANDSILHGITRDITLKIAKNIGFNISDKPLHYKDIQKCDEAFLTSTIKEILPITKIDDFIIPRGDKVDVLLTHFNKTK